MCSILLLPVIALWIGCCLGSLNPGAEKMSDFCDTISCRGVKNKKKQEEVKANEGKGTNVESINVDEEPKPHLVSPENDAESCCDKMKLNSKKCVSIVTMAVNLFLTICIIVIYYNNVFS